MPKATQGLGWTTSLVVLCFACKGHDRARAVASDGVAVPGATSTASTENQGPSAPTSVLPQLHVVARFDDTPNLHEVTGALFVSENNWLARVNDAELVVDESLRTWVSREDAAWFGLELSGTWPTEMVGAFTLSRGEHSSSHVLRYSNGRWDEVADIPDASVFAASLWTEHRILALKYPPGESAGLRFATRFASWPATPRLPKLAPAPPTDGRDESGADVCKHGNTALVPCAMLGLTTGHVFVGGATCEKRDLAVEWFTPGETRSRMQILKQQEDRGPSGYFAVRAPGDVYLALGSIGGSVLAHYDGNAWTVLDTPFSGFISSLDVTPDEVLFVVARPVPYRQKGPPEDKFAVREGDEGQLWRRSPEGAWTHIPVPDDVPMLHDRFHAGVHGVAAPTATDVWVTAGTALLHTRPPVVAIRNLGNRGVEGRSDRR